jgi:glycosyltransferase involved in cell wall biosynthesis
MSDTNIAFLYPRISHYREEFFAYFQKNYHCHIFVYENDQENKRNHFKISKVPTIRLNSFLLFSRLRIFNFFPLLHPKYKILILIAEMKVLPLWFILIFAKLMNKKVILWGHGISIHTYLKEEKKLNSIRVLFNKLANYLWLYTEKEKNIWKKYIPDNKITALNNTINIENILEQESLNIDMLKEKYHLDTEINFIYCARFSMQERRTDLLVEIINQLDPNKYGFLIIGDGPLKPDFSHYANVIDFGSVYERHQKNEIFQLADLYIQPGWIGLSCNEALAYGKPILTFKRSEEIRQCVEYAYLNKSNSYIANDMNDMISFISSLTQQEIQRYQKNSRNYAKKNLRMDVMIKHAEDSINHILTDLSI